MSSPAPDSGIPLLTEIIPDGADAGASGPAITPGQNSPLLPAKADAGPLLDEDQWARLERDIRDRIVEQLRMRVDTLIEQRVRESLGDLLQVAMVAIAQELRVNIHQALGDTVSEAVAIEIATLRK